MTHASLPIPSVSTPSPTSYPLVMEGEFLCCGSVRQNVWTGRSCDCRAEEEEETGKVMSGADFHIGGSVEMKEVLQYPSHLLEQRFFLVFLTPPHSQMHMYQTGI